MINNRYNDFFVSLMIVILYYKNWFLRHSWNKHTLKVTPSAIQSHFYNYIFPFYIDIIGWFVFLRAKFLPNLCFSDDYSFKGSVLFLKILEVPPVFLMINLLFFSIFSNFPSVLLCTIALLIRLEIRISDQEWLRWYRNFSSWDKIAFYLSGHSSIIYVQSSVHSLTISLMLTLFCIRKLFIFYFMRSNKSFVHYFPN